MENKSHALAAGAFVLLLAALMVSLAAWLTRDNRPLRLYELSSSETVTGLQPQASVRFKGVNVGKVIAIGLDPLAPGHVLIRIAIDEQAPITAATFATLGFQGVTGLAFVQLDDSGASGTSLPTQPEAPARIPMRPSLLSKLSDQSENVMQALLEAIHRVNQLLSDDRQKNGARVLDEIGKAATSLQHLSAHADQALPPLTQDAQATLQSLQTAANRVGASADEIRESANTFKRAVDDTARVAQQVGQAASTVTNNPRSLIFGNGPAAPGPGEPGFSPPSSTP